MVNKTNVHWKIYFEFISTFFTVLQFLSVIDCNFILQLPDESFSIFLEYVAGGSESLKKLVTAKANEVTEEMEKWQSLSDEEKLTIPKIDEIKYSRARSLLQNID